MKKLSMDELGRMTVEQYRQSDKLPLTVVLDNVRSLNNIGSVFRTSDAFRLEGLALCGITATPPHRDIHKTALGAEDSVEWRYYEETADCLRQLKEQGHRLLAVEQVDDSLKLDDDDALRRLLADAPKVAIVMGNEVEGVQQELIPLCDASLEIPQYGTKHSLNVSCAAAIVIWELSRRLRL